jgi:hypothetical protein
MDLLTNWPDAIAKVERSVYRISTDFGDGTGFLVHAFKGTMTIVTAWHVIEELASVPNKHARRIALDSAVGGHRIEANAVGLARLGPPELDIGIVWIGRHFDGPQVDGIIISLGSSGIKGGLLDLSGGGGITALSEGPIRLRELDYPALLPDERPQKGIELGWMGYPSIASETPCAFRGILSGQLTEPPMLLVDGTGIPGLSGGPVFNGRGQILAIISGLLQEEDTMTGLIAAMPIDGVWRVLKGLAREL